MQSILTEKTDRDLVALAKSKNNGAFEELLKRYKAKIYCHALGITRNPHDAEDVLQDTFFNAFKHIHGFRQDSSFKTWLYKIGTNNALMRLRKEKYLQWDYLDAPLHYNDVEVPREIMDWSMNPEELYEWDEFKAILEDAVDSLPQLYKTIFWLRDIDGFSNPETAEILDLSISAVKSRILRARLQLRDSLNSYFNDGNKATGCHGA